MKLTESKLKQLIVETLQEGYMDYIRAEEEAHNNFKKVRALKQQGKATYDEVSAAYEEYENVKKNRDSYFTPEELEAEKSWYADYNAKADAEAIAQSEEEEAAEKRRREAEAAQMMKARQDKSYRGKMIRQMANDPVPGEQWFDKDG